MSLISNAVVIVFCSLTTSLLMSKPATLKPLWTTSAGLANPESVLVVGDTLYVSNVAGEALAKDGKGWIGMMKPDGTWIKQQWITGLNAPKGMGKYGDSLWVTDIDVLVEISISKGLVSKRTPVKDAVFLNDITVSSDGTVYVSDMKTSRIYTLAGGKLTLLLDPKQLSHPNGLWIDGDQLYIVNWGLKMDEQFATRALGHLAVYNLKSGKMKLISDALGHLDGLVRTKDSWIISDWMAGKVFRLGTNAKHADLLITGLKSAADLGLGADGVLYVPDMVDSKISAYKL